MNRTRQADLGTPASPATDTVEIEIDGRPASVKTGTSILRAARESGIDIPKLCATDSLKPFGSCRLCLVEVEGRKGYPASCTTPVEAGENRGRTLTNYNVVRDFRPIGRWTGGAMTLDLGPDDLANGGDGCAVLVQENRGKGRIMGGDLVWLEQS